MTEKPEMAQRAVTLGHEVGPLKNQSIPSLGPPISSVATPLSSTEPQTKAESTFEPPRTNLWMLPIPKRLRQDPDPDNAFVLSLPLNLLFGFASTFTVANLYYEAFGNVSYDRISVVTTLVQAGYAIGLLLIAPLGDLVRRRSLVLVLVFLTATLSIGLALANSLVAFQVIGFFVAILSVPPQIFIPLTADLAPANRRSSAISITLSGLLLGLLVGRVLAGTIAHYSASYRNVYWMAVGLQYFILVALYFTLPDYPRKVKGVNYFQMLWSMATYIWTYPTLVQCCLIGFLCSALFTNWWTVLSFLLSDPPYHYNSFQIGLFGLAGLLGVFAAPFTGRLVDNLVPWVGQLFALGTLIIFQAIALATADRNIGGVIIVAFGLDLGLQLNQVSNSTRVYSLNPAARARMNSIFIISLFLGQTMGSSAGTRAYTKGGWHAAAGLSLGWLGLALGILLVRGPHAKKWIGWDGGNRMRKSDDEEQGKENIEEPKEANAKGTVKGEVTDEHGSGILEMKTKRPGDDAGEEDDKRQSIEIAPRRLGDNDQQLPQPSLGLGV